MNNPLKVLIAGGSGFVGTHLQNYLSANGFHVQVLTRGPEGANRIYWDSGKSPLSNKLLDEIDVLINLAGANIASSRWSDQRMRVIRESRLSSTGALVEAMRNSDSPPSVFISMSGVNYYSSGNDVKTEVSPAGDSFLSQVCQDWEKEAFAAKGFGVRVVALRLGVVLNRSGGALKKMLPAYRMGLGGPIGPGSQGFPWITMDDLLDVILFAIQTKSLSGPINVVHPYMITQEGFARELARVLNRPALMRLPQWIVRMIFGQMGEETMLTNLNVKPQYLLKKGFSFKENDLGKSLESIFFEK